jgi:membrane protease YdiL (CAAX protease family)
MSDEDREPSSDPFGPPESESGERAMTYFGAVGWTLLSTSLFLFLVLIMMSIRPGAGNDLITNFGFQLVATLLTLFCILRFYAPNTSIRHFVGLRGTHGGFYVLAAVLGVVIQVPTTALYNVIVKRFPGPVDNDSHLMEDLARGTPWRVALCVIIVFAGPFLEEVFFRGALFRPLKKQSTTFGVILLSSLLFALAHLEKQIFLPIAIVGITLGILRSASGSLIPSIIMHTTFNGAAFWSMYERFRSGKPSTSEASVPMPILLTASLGALLLVAITYVVGQRSEAAREARSEDLV